MRTKKISVAVHFFIIVLYLGVANESFGIPPKFIDLEISTPATNFSPDELIPVTILVRFQEEADNASIRIQSDGAVYSDFTEEKSEGPFLPGDELTFKAFASSHDIGQGTLTVEVEDLNSDDKVQFGRLAKLFAVCDEQRTWISTSSPTDLRIKRLLALSGGNATIAAQKAEPEMETMEDIVTARGYKGRYTS